MPLVNIDESTLRRIVNTTKTVERGVLHSPNVYRGASGQIFGGLKSFQIYQYPSDPTSGADWWRKFRVHRGFIMPPPPPGNFSHPNNDDGAGSPLLISPAASTTTEVYLKMEFSGGFFSSITIVSDTGIVSYGANIGLPNIRAVSGFWYCPLGKIVLGADPVYISGPYPSGTITITQFQTSDLFLSFPTFAVTLVADGGSSPNWTYSVYAELFVGALLATGISPAINAANANSFGKPVNVADTGIATYDDSGNIVLVYANETF